MTFGQRIWSAITSGPVGHLDWLRACVGALLGIGLTAFVCHMWLGKDAGLPYLVAPMGASAVLLFAVPASPLARPWAVFAGNVISTTVGVASSKLLGDPLLAAPVAVAGAIAAMRAARCLHPPGGAAALTAVLGSPAIKAAGWLYIFSPMALNSALLVALAWLLNNAMRHPYPHRVDHTHSSPAYERGDVEAVLARQDELLDIDADDLDRLLQLVLDEAGARKAAKVAPARPSLF